MLHLCRNLIDSLLHIFLLKFQLGLNWMWKIMLFKRHMYCSYSEDYLNAEMLPPEKNKEDFYINIKSAAESGWDFSSRWFISNGTNQGKIKVSHILADMHTNCTWQNQEKISGLLHHVDWHIVTRLKSLYHQHHGCENLNLTMVEAISTNFLQTH